MLVDDSDTTFSSGHVDFKGGAKMCQFLGSCHRLISYFTAVTFYVKPDTASFINNSSYHESRDFPLISTNSTHCKNCHIGAGGPDICHAVDCSKLPYWGAGRNLDRKRILAYFESHRQNATFCIYNPIVGLKTELGGLWLIPPRHNFFNWAEGVMKRAGVKAPTPTILTLIQPLEISLHY